MKIDQKIKILIVDDFESMIRVTMDSLVFLGANFTNLYSANNGAEALKILRKQKIDFVITDWNMPVMSGIQLLKTIRADESLNRLPVMMITGETDRNYIQEAIDNGVNSLLLKPYTREKLNRHIEIALKTSFRAINQSGNPSKAIEEAQASNAKTDPAVILIVDDAQNNLLLLMRLLQPKFKVLIANSGQKALEICQSDTPPDLVLLDIIMPDMDGFEVAQQLRAHPVSEFIPVIFVTAIDSLEAKLKGLSLGAVDVISKPIQPSILMSKIENFLHYIELNKQLQNNYDMMLEDAKLKENVDRITRHDINGVLSGVVGMIQSMVDDRSLSNQQITKLHQMEEIALQAVNMINLSLVLYRIETDQFHLQAKVIDIKDILQRIVEMSRTMFRSKKITISIGVDEIVGQPVPNLLGDAMLCYSIFQNLIKNACEAAPENSKVLVHMYDENPLRFTIQNTGAVPSAIRDNFFEKFVTHGKSDGNGLGTYSAKLLTEAQHGSIQLDVSDEIDLTTITVCLPRDQMTM